MLKVLRLEIDAMGMMVLFVMLFNLCKKEDSQETPDQKFFEILLYTNIMLLIFDASMWFIDYQTFWMAREINQVISTIYYILNPAGCLLWLLYNDYKINRDKNRIIHKMPLYSIPFLINTMLAVMSPFNGGLFCITEDNVYKRGRFFLAMPVLAFIYVFYAAYITIIKAKDCDDIAKKEAYRYMIAFPLLPFVGSLIQCVIYGLPLIWNFSAISLLIIFNNLQNKEIATDKLTGLYNRRYMEDYLAWKMQSIKENELLFIILIDVDKFKAINDQFGHLSGDKALQEVASILKMCCSKCQDLPIRLGGDEFMVIGQRRNVQAIEEMISGIIQGAYEVSRTCSRKYRLSLSMGYAVWGSEGIECIDDLINEADRKMYENKIINHRMMEKIII